MSERPDESVVRALPSALTVRRRSAGSVLVTVSGQGGLILEGLTEAETTAVVGLTAALRAPRGDRTRPAPSARWSHILDFICRAAARLSPDGPTDGQILVLGDGPLPDEIVRVLAPIVGRVVTEPEALLAPDLDPVTRTPDLVVLPAVDAVTPLAGRPWHSREVPQLPVIVSGGRLAVGPLVRPAAGPCLTCLDLHRGARDPGWAPWLASRALRSDIDPQLDALPELRAAAAALTALIVRGMLDDQLLPPGVSLSLECPQPRIRHHLWTRHPSCCGTADTRVTMNA